MIDIIYKTVKPSHSKKYKTIRLQVLQNIKSLMFRKSNLQIF